jgi:hypothetical protein
MPIHLRECQTGVAGVETPAFALVGINECHDILEQ